MLDAVVHNELGWLGLTWGWLWLIWGWLGMPWGRLEAHLGGRWGDLGQLGAEIR